MNILVTGASAGIGLATARELAAMGHHVLVHGRSAARAQQAVEAIRRDRPAANCQPENCDLASLEAVRAWGTRLRDNELDVVIHNAGVWMQERTETVDGFETTWAVNHLAPFLLTQLLLDRLLERPDSRVINVSSIGHTAGEIHFDDPNMRRGFTGLKAYCQSKLANLLFTQELARRTQASSLVTHALHPGVIQTKLLQRTGFSNQPTESAETGAETSVFLATEPSALQGSGRYWVRSRPARAKAVRPEVARRLWEMSMEQCGLR